jgi:hypothetical protein
MPEKKAPQSKTKGVVFDVVGADAIDARLSAMMDKINTLSVADTLTEWQREDMKRQYPNIEITNPTSAFTTIWPRSRRDSGWLKKQAPSKRRSKWQTPRLVKRFSMGKHTTTTDRPILRPVLFEKLRERVRALAEHLKWTVVK